MYLLCDLEFKKGFPDCFVAFKLSALRTFSFIFVFEEFKVYLGCFCRTFLGKEEALKLLLCPSHRFAPDIYFSIVNLTPQRSVMSIKPSSDSSKWCTMPAGRFKDAATRQAWQRRGEGSPSIHLCQHLCLSSFAVQSGGSGIHSVSGKLLFTLSRVQSCPARISLIQAAQTLTYISSRVRRPLRCFTGSIPFQAQWFITLTTCNLSHFDASCFGTNKLVHSLCVGFSTCFPTNWDAAATLAFFCNVKSWTLKAFRRSFEGNAGRQELKTTPRAA